ncbi:helix-turn-helix domain-containing protein [Nonomuraea rhizosphaerae]|uniref:helix-turn-helix domain-containing protein n=1 Tax=Nonomuraea rhizosphaerae TaxID=2665663 RepID=UPI001C5D1E0E|nr:helix-turn-helix domain-containing protein [Nonomuraea rhizosphaerae]
MPEQSTGAMLAAARKSAGLTVTQLSETTRIREAIIHAIERDDFSQCGGDFYVRGHIKAVAKAVGLDPDTVVHLFEQEHGGGPAPVRAAAVFQADRLIKLGERRGPNWTMALGVALAIVMVFGAVRVLGGGTSDEVRTADVHPVPANSPITERPRAKPSHAAGKVIAAKDLVVVKIKAKRSSYVSVRDAKGRKLFSGTLKAGKSSTWRAATKVQLLLEDAGAVSLQVNGKNLGRPGARGETVRRTFGPSAPRPR